MESITAIVAAGAALGLSFFIGRSMVATKPVIALMGAACGAAFSILFFIVTVSVGAVMPGMFEGWELGVHFIALIAIVPAACAGLALLEQRHLERVEAQRLPF
jgi:uncharacterized membrane protein